MFSHARWRKATANIERPRNATLPPAVYSAVKEHISAHPGKQLNTTEPAKLGASRSGVKLVARFFERQVQRQVLDPPYRRPSGNPNLVRVREIELAIATIFRKHPRGGKIHFLVVLEMVRKRTGFVLSGRLAKRLFSELNSHGRKENRFELVGQLPNKGSILDYAASLESRGIRVKRVFNKPRHGQYAFGGGGQA